MEFGNLISNVSIGSAFFIISNFSIIYLNYFNKMVHRIYYNTIYCCIFSRLDKYLLI
jgi:hypothetical protein